LHYKYSGLWNHVSSIISRKEKCKLIGYIDSNWCGEIDDRKSTACYIFLFEGSPVSWCSTKEPLVSLYSCEVEYIAASLYACQVVWLMNLIYEIDSEKCEVVALRIDNILAINLDINPITHGRSKHIEM